MLVLLWLLSVLLWLFTGVGAKEGVAVHVAGAVSVVVVLVLHKDFGRDLVEVVVVVVVRIVVIVVVVSFGREVGREGGVSDVLFPRFGSSVLFGVPRGPRPDKV